MFPDGTVSVVFKLFDCSTLISKTLIVTFSLTVAFIICFTFLKFEVIYFVVCDRVSTKFSLTYTKMLKFVHSFAIDVPDQRVKLFDCRFFLLLVKVSNSIG